MASNDSHGLTMHLAGRVAQRVPGLRMIPVVRLIMIGELVLVGKHHLDRLSAAERGEMIGLVSKGKGRPKNLSEADQARLQTLIEKLDAREFLAEAADRISPVGVPSPVRNKLSGAKKKPGT